MVFSMTIVRYSLLAAKCHLFSLSKACPRDYIVRLSSGSRVQVREIYHRSPAALKEILTGRMECGLDYEGSGAVIVF